MDELAAPSKAFALLREAINLSGAWVYGGPFQKDYGELPQHERGRR